MTKVVLFPMSSRGSVIVKLIEFFKQFSTFVDLLSVSFSRAKLSSRATFEVIFPLKVSPKADSKAGFPDP